MPHIVDTLREDHERMAELFKRIRQMTDGSAERRGDLGRVLAQELLTHAAFVEDVFYPAVRERGTDVTGLLGTAVSEHHEVEDVLERLLEMDPASTEFTEAVRELEAAVAEHVRREEEEIFPVALRVIGAYEAEEMSKRHDAMTRDHA